MVGLQLSAECGSGSLVIVPFNLGCARGVNALCVLKTIKPVEEKTNVVTQNMSRFTMD